MSDQRNNRHCGTGFSPVTPDPGSKGWQRVIARGCGAATYHGPDGPDDYCRHDYLWSCDECPVGIVMMEEAAADYERQMVGPPTPLSILAKDGEIWCDPWEHFR